MTKGHHQKKMTKGQWSPDEDSILKEKVAEFGVKQWKKIAKSIGGRIGKQCRERWYNHLNPYIKTGPWTKEEDAIIIEAHKEVGNKWTEISKRLHGRPENSVKNHWNSVRRRVTFDNSGGSLLQAYIKQIEDSRKKEQEQEEEEVAPENANLNHVDEANNNDMPLDGVEDHHDDIGDLVRVIFPNLDFNNEDWVSDLLDSPMDSDLNPLGKD